MSKYGPTSAPWNVLGVYLTHNHPTHAWEARVWHVTSPVGIGIGMYETEAIANAHLIAAAPEMFAALKAARFRLFGAGPSNDPLYAKISAALAAAEA